MLAATKGGGGWGRGQWTELPMMSKNCFLKFETAPSIAKCAKQNSFTNCFHHYS